MAIHRTSRAVPRLIIPGAGLRVAVAAAAAASLSLVPVAAMAQSRGRPNIVFIMTDDHAAHAIGAYGSRVNTTPNLDRLAREGVLMSSVFATNRQFSSGN